jgi:hypothetical protein
MGNNIVDNVLSSVVDVFYYVTVLWYIVYVYCIVSLFRRETSTVF